MSEAQERYKQGGLFVAVVACPNNMSPSLIHDLRSIYEDPALRVSGLLSGLNLEFDDQGFNLVRDNTRDISVEFEELAGKRRTKTLERWVRDHITGKRHSLGFGYDRIGLDLLFYETDIDDSRIVDSWLLENFIPGEVSPLETNRNVEEVGGSLYHFCRGWIARNEAVEKLAYAEFCKRKGIDQSQAEGRFGALTNNSLAALHVREIYLEEEMPDLVEEYRNWCFSFEEITDEAKQNWLTKHGVPARVSEIMAHALAKEVIEQRKQEQANDQFLENTKTQKRGETGSFVHFDESPYVPALIQADLGSSPTLRAILMLVDELAGVDATATLRSLEEQYRDVFGDSVDYDEFIESRIFGEGDDYVLAYQHCTADGCCFWGVHKNHIAERINFLGRELEYSEEAIERMVATTAQPATPNNGEPVFEFAQPIVSNVVINPSEGVEYQKKIESLIGKNFDLVFVSDDELAGRPYVLKPIVHQGVSVEGVVTLGIPERYRVSTFDQVGNLKAALDYLFGVFPNGSV